MVKRPRPESDTPCHQGVQSMTDARQLWLRAKSASDMEEVESFLKSRMKQLKEAREASKVRQVLSDEEKNVREKLVLLLIQSGRGELAIGGLQASGYTTTLARCVLGYNFELSESTDKSNNETAATERAPCIVVDNALPQLSFQSLREALAPIAAPYWESYSIEPPSPYFSYVTPLTEVDKLGSLGTLIRTVHTLGIRRFGEEAMKDVQFAEIWAHNRPHASGHQLHFDSDDEGRGGVRHPVVSSVCFLKGEVGGPTLFTNQRLGDKRLGTKAWLCKPKENRIAVFDGSVLHGVIPGKGLSPQCDQTRVTLMVALWKEITIRPGKDRGSARPFPEQGKSFPLWAQQLTAGKVQSPHPAAESPEVTPLTLPRLWETSTMEPWPKDAPIPPYDRVYQGF